MTQSFPIPHGYVMLGEAFDLAYASLETAQAVRSERDLGARRIAPGLWGLNLQAVALEDEARGRMEQKFRNALQSGTLRAFAYNPTGSQWGEIPDRECWRGRSFAPGLETKIDPTISAGPHVGRSPIFLEVSEFQRWLAGMVKEHASVGIRTGKKGRPNVSKLFREEFRRRQSAGLTKGSLTEEVRALFEWFSLDYPVTMRPQEKTIRAAIRPLFKS